MSRRRLIRATAAAVLAAGIGFALPSSAGSSAPRQLAATTTITADHSGTAELILTDDARLSVANQANPDVRITGPGRVVAFGLQRVDGAGDGLLAVRVPAFAGGATYVSGSYWPAPYCTGSPNNTVALSTTCTTPKAILLHEGVYRLTVLT